MRKIFLICFFITQAPASFAADFSLASVCEMIAQPYRLMRARKSGESRVRYNAEALRANALAVEADPELKAISDTLNSALHTVLASDMKLFTFDVEGDQDLMDFKRGTVIETYFSLVGHAKALDGTEQVFKQFRWKVRGIL